MTPLPSDRGFLHIVVLLLLPLLSALAVGPSPAGAQEQAPTQERLRVFLDCASRNCDRDQFRREITFVDWVREPQDADLHVIMTSQGAGGGGQQYTFDFVGREELEGFEDDFMFSSSPTDVRDEVIEGLTRVLRQGLVRFVSLAGYGELLEIRGRNGGGAGAEETETRATPEDDPWDFWVFSVSGNVSVESEDREDSQEYRFGLNANRTTEAWKLNVRANGEFLRQDFELEDGVVENDQDEWGASAFAVKSLGEHAGVGVEVEVDRSTQLNRDLLVAAGTGVEWNYFPYEESNRRELVARYVVSIERFEYQDTTIFDVLEETAYLHELSLSYESREPWGSANLRAGAGQFLDRTDFYSVRVGGRVDYRLFRGLSVELDGEYSLVRDQIYLSKAELSDEDILLGRRRLPTDSEFEVSVGFRYSFGSIFNNVVNPRFGFGVR